MAAVTAARRVARVDGPAAGAAGGGVFPESKVTDVVVRLDGPLLADEVG
jgi:hypothetical protein